MHDRRDRRYGMSKTRPLFCCGCQADVSARLTSGKEIYPHRRDLHDLPFWKCDVCKNFVGCHHKTKDRTRPLGCIPTPAIKRERQRIHQVLDPIWKSGRYGRRELYSMVAHVLGVEEYHTAEIRSVEQAREVYRIVSEIGGAA